jgi:uncharacterized protein YjeT (DUF2065 family)
LLVAAIGLALFLEGLPYFVSPPGVRKALQAVGSMNDGAIRLIGFALMLTGLVVVYLALHGWR